MGYMGILLQYTQSHILSTLRGTKKPQTLKPQRLQVLGGVGGKLFTGAQRNGYVDPVISRKKDPKSTSALPLEHLFCLWLRSFLGSVYGVLD